MESSRRKLPEKALLANLLAVYRRQLDALQAGLQPLQDERARCDHLLELLRADAALVAAQRQVWEQQWQQWLQEGGSLWNGRGHNARHQQLTELEKLLAKHRDEIEKRRIAIQQKIAQQNQRILRQQQKIDYVQASLAAARREIAAIAERRDANSDEERILAQWLEMRREPAVMEA